MRSIIYHPVDEIAGPAWIGREPELAMALGREGETQGEPMVGRAKMPRSPAHTFYDPLQKVITAADFDGFVEEQRVAHCASRRGHPSLPPGPYFRMHLVGYFDGIDSESGLEWRCSGSLLLHDFLRLAPRGSIPDHSWGSRTHGRMIGHGTRRKSGITLRAVVAIVLLKDGTFIIMRGVTLLH